MEADNWLSGVSDCMCPLTTCNAYGTMEPELRAYKLGKGRGAYNRCSILLQKGGTGLIQSTSHRLTVLTAAPVEKQAEPGLVYRLLLSNGLQVCANFFLVYEHPFQAQDSGSKNPPADATSDHIFHWRMVSRSDCRKGCTGPLLRSIQRFGRMGRLSNKPPQAEQQSHCQHKGRQDGFMYVAIDEACKHVQTKHFRLLVGIFDGESNELLGTSCSQKIRMVANNDCPTGAAFIQVAVPIKQSWKGWTHVAGLELSTLKSQKVIIPEVPVQLQSQGCSHDSLRKDSSKATLQGSSVQTSYAVQSTSIGVLGARCLHDGDVAEDWRRPETCEDTSDATRANMCRENDAFHTKLARDRNSLAFRVGHLSATDVVPVLYGQSGQQQIPAVVPRRSGSDLEQFCAARLATSSDILLKRRQVHRLSSPLRSPLRCQAISQDLQTSLWPVERRPWDHPLPSAQHNDKLDSPSVLVTPASSLLRQAGVASTMFVPTLQSACAWADQGSGLAANSDNCSCSSVSGHRSTLDSDHIENRAEEADCSRHLAEMLNKQNAWDSQSPAKGLCDHVLGVDQDLHDAASAVLSPRDPRGQSKVVQAIEQHGESSSLVGIKRKLDWHVDQLAVEKQKVSELQHALQLSDQHLSELHHVMRGFIGQHAGYSVVNKTLGYSSSL